MLRSAEIYHYLQHATDYGLRAAKVGYDAKAVVERSRKVAKRLNDGVAFLMKKNKIAVIWGEARLDAPGRISVKPPRSAVPKGALGAGSYQAAHIIIATGARPRVLPGLEPDQRLIWTYFEAMLPCAMPKSLLVVGLRRDRHGVRLVLSLLWGRGHGRRDPAANPSRGGCRDCPVRPQGASSVRASRSSPRPS